MKINELVSTKINDKTLRIVFIFWASAVIFLGLALLTGCRTAGGKGYSYSCVEKYNDNGKITYREIKTDKNSIGVKGLFASDKASQVGYDRTNFMGTASRTVIGDMNGTTQNASDMGNAVVNIISNIVQSIKK